jgi:MFS family permease
MFTLVNFMTIPIQGKIGEMVSNRALFAAIESIIIALVAVISGFVADKWGRKRLTIVGFIMLGIGYAVIGLSPDLTGSLVYIISDGVAWGIFYVLFLFTLWGDLSQSGRSDKFYFLGALPYVSSYFMQTLFSGYIKGIEPTTMFSFASVFLFLAVLPLIYAPETLPEKLMKDRDLKSYIEKAKKRAQKESHKSHKSKVLPQNIQVKEEIEAKSTVEYEDAAKLAEKYY